MKTLYEFFKHEYRRLTTVTGIILGAIFLISILFVVLNGTVKYDRELEDVKKFKVFEKLLVENYVSYNFYGHTGFNVKYIPPPTVIFFNTSGLFSELATKITVGIDTNMYHSLNGRDSFAEKQGSNDDFPGFLLIWGSILALFYGFTTFRNKKYMRFLVSLGNANRFYAYIMMARFLLMSLYFAIVFALSIALVLIKGIMLSWSDCLILIGFYFVWLLIALINFVIGTAISSSKIPNTGIAIILVLWGLNTHTIPMVINTIVTEKASTIEVNRESELKKWKLLCQFEARALKEMGRFNPKKANTAEVHKLIDSFKQNEYKKMREVDEMVEKQTRAMTQTSYTYNIWFFTTFFKSMACEWSGKGHEGLNDYFRYNRQLKHEFCQYHEQKRFYSSQKKVVSFVKGDENLYFAKVHLPAHLLPGILVCLGYFMLFLVVSFYRYKVVLFTHAVAHKKEPKAISPLLGATLQFEPGQYRVLKTDKPRFSEYLYGLLAGYKSPRIKAYFSGDNEVFLGTQKITAPSSPIHFLYLCHGAFIPGEIRVSDLIGIVTSLLGISSAERKVFYRDFGLESIRNEPFEALENIQKFQILIAIAQWRPYRFYFFDNITQDTPIEASISLKAWMEKLAKTNAYVLLLTAQSGFSAVNQKEDGDIWDVTDIWFNTKIENHKSSPS